MSLKITAENLAANDQDHLPTEDKKTVVIVRQYDEERDKLAVEELEGQCDFGQRGQPSLFTDLMGDPISRIRNLPLHVMLVAEAECGKDREIVGIIRGSIKTVTRGNKGSTPCPAYVKIAYILGLRVSSQHRRLGIGTKLVEELEEWSRSNGAKYTYMATDSNNQASIKLFTSKCNYVKFRTPSVLVQPVHAHYKPIASDIAIVRVSPQLSESFYRRIFANSEFFPKDINHILNNNLSFGTFMAVPKKTLLNWDPKSGSFPSTFAILSVWNTKDIYKLQVRGISPLKYACCLGTRVLDSWMPWLRVPSIPNIFKSFGFYLLYGIHMEGKEGPRLMKNLCAFAHNMGRNDRECSLLVAEVGVDDPVKEAIPRWNKFSWGDLWCMKNLEFKNGESEDNWVESPVSSCSVIFVDPRDF
ncbi:PREDICTED: probable N-acetyltransferase HLS1 [Nicotiana attenuata]|uniref:N-acetyltransferase hls1 n=1 Tax=Nicotiana attenuata TaxID=49451 RepID=A0A1J6J593_NICAT|nr:PREDICTED: probable N-acetyltransferase HLS1 [Nicotiana attenuata]OIT05039.1 putative n-acetyltransferase hls1 [Nicotiana attenuata]